MWSTGEVERIECPEEYRERLAEVGGLNPYGEPNFKLGWAQTETFRAGSDEMLLGDGTPHWMLMEWHPASDYGYRESWYSQNRAMDVHLEYPATGKYEVVINLVSRSMKNGELAIEPIPLSWVVVEVMVPIIIEARKVSLLRRKLTFIEQREREKAQRLSAIEDAISQSRPAFGSSARSSEYLECNSLVHKRAESIERYWNKIAGVIANRPKGMNQMARRPVIN